MEPKEAIRRQIDYCQEELNRLRVFAKYAEVLHICPNGYNPLPFHVYSPERIRQIFDIIEAEITEKTKLRTNELKQLENNA